MIQFPFIGPSYPDQALPFASQRTVNFYPETDENYKDKVVLQSFPGHTAWVTVGNGPIRGHVHFDGKLVIVSGKGVYTLDTGGDANFVGFINTEFGFVGIDTNGTQVMIVDGHDGWVYDGTTLTQITDTTFTATRATQVAHMDSFFVVNQPGTGNIWVSDSFDGLNWNALRTATAEFKSDNIEAVWADRELYLGGTFTTQAYYNSGASPMPFEAIRSSRIVYGIASPDSVAVIGDTSYMLCQEQNGGIFIGRLNGATIEKVSNPAWEKLWVTYDYWDAYAFGMQFQGHEWYVLTFPKADHGEGRTVVFDIATGWWFEIGKYSHSASDFIKHPGLTHTYFGGKSLIGDINGRMLEMSGTVYRFDVDAMISLRRSPVIHDRRQKLSIRNFTVDLETGNSTADNRGPRLRFRHSKDGGYTWKNTRYAETSRQGVAGVSLSNKRKKEVQFRQLGQARDWVMEVSISDLVTRKLMGGYIE